MPGKETPAARARRTLILRVLATSPGLSFRALSRATGIHHGNLAQHLEVLRRRNQAWRLAIGKRHWHFAGAEPERSEDRLACVRRGLDDADQRLLTWLAEAGTACQKQILERFPHLPRSTVQFRLRRLAARGLPLAETRGSFVVYAIAVTSSAPEGVESQQGPCGSRIS